MKNTLTLLCLLFSYTLANAQARLGSTFDYIKTEFADTSYHLETRFSKANDLVLLVQLDKCEVQHVFNSEKICEMSFVVPKGQGALNYFVESYNEQFVIINSKKWKMYSNNGICDVELVFPENDSCYFVWKVE